MPTWTVPLADVVVPEEDIAPVAETYRSGWLSVVVLDDAIDRDARGVQTSVHYPPVHGFSIYADGAPALPITEAYGARAVSLPLFAHMTDEQQDTVVEAVRAALPAAARAGAR